MIQLTKLLMEVQLGHFFHVTAIDANRNYVSILAENNTEFIIVIAAADTFETKGMFGDLSEAEGSVVIPGLRIFNVPLVEFTDDKLSIHTETGIVFTWDIYR